MGARGGLEGCRILAATGIRSPVRPARSAVAIPTELSRPLNMHVDISKFESSHNCLQTCTKYANINISKRSGTQSIRTDIAMFYDVFIQNTCLIYVLRTPNV